MEKRKPVSLEEAEKALDMLTMLTYPMRDETWRPHIAALSNALGDMRHLLVDLAKTYGKPEMWVDANLRARIMDALEK